MIEAKKSKSESNKENGKKGGRPKGFSGMVAEKIRSKVASKLFDNIDQITNKAIQQAIKGDRYAREWLMTYVVSKAVQNIGLQGGDSDKPLIFQVSQEVLKKHADTSQ